MAAAARRQPRDRRVRQAWKELVYQIVSERSSGSRIWDVDGNEYIDTANGFGTNLFGHSPDFVVAAVKAQLDRGFAVGVQSDLLGEVAEMTCAMTGNDRLAFTTSGGEAVETAIRVARTVTDRDKIAYFTDDIHGRSDIVLGRRSSERRCPHGAHGGGRPPACRRRRTRARVRHRPCPRGDPRPCR